MSTTVMICLGLGIVLVFGLGYALRADPKEVDKQTDEFFQRRYREDARNNFSR